MPGQFIRRKAAGRIQSTEITGFDESDSEAYYVESVRLETYSPKSNVVFVDHTGITGVEADEPLIVRGYDGFIRIDVAAPQTGCRIFDMSGPRNTLYRHNRFQPRHRHAHRHLPYHHRPALTPGQGSGTINKHYPLTRALLRTSRQPG